MYILDHVLSYSVTINYNNYDNNQISCVKHVIIANIARVTNFKHL